ncbi:MAG TPA: hypothetical protein VK935_07740 [Actinomycetospora sp.]|nr:hypothetical protein [Actinomycetospora sp.]
MHTAPDGLDVEFEEAGLVIRSGRWGAMHVALYRLPPGMDLAPFFAPLPGGLCPCNHWGYMIAGQIVVRYGDGSNETNRAGELFHWPGGHTAWTDEGTEFVAYTPWQEEERASARLAAASRS